MELLVSGSFFLLCLSLNKVLTLRSEALHLRWVGLLRL
jgi:hypothetical protein